MHNKKTCITIGLIFILALLTFLAFDIFKLDKKDVSVNTKVKAVPYKISKENYKNNNIMISFPKVIGLANYNNEQKINHIIKNDALKILDYYKTADNNLNLDINYDIKLKENDLLSIQYSGVGYVKGAAHPNNLFYTTNVDIKNQSRLRLKDKIIIDQNFIDKLRKGEYKTAGSEKNSELKAAVFNVLNSYSNQELMKILNESDILYSSSNENQSGAFSYFTNDSIGISLSMPHAIGDHAEFEIKNKDIKDNIKYLNYYI